MGFLKQGEWADEWYDTKKSGGKFVRQDSQFRNQVTADGKNGFKAEAGRYQLYVSLACPWAHRTLIFRHLKNLESYIDVTVVDPVMLDNGWELDDPLYGLKYLYELYLKADPDYEGRVTVPVLWDRKTETIVNNESAEIIRMFNSAFNHLTDNTDDYYPIELRDNIDQINERVYSSINNGVYRAGFATTQEAYTEAYYALFDSLDWVEKTLAQHRYIAGDKLTEADWRLFTTLIRFDAVYYGHFKTNRQLLSSFPNISAYVRDLYQTKDVASTVDFMHIKTHYYASHKTINPTGVIPAGPALDFCFSHDRDRKFR